jgi:tetratricopeptide (TPR) repeat protein
LTLAGTARADDPVVIYGLPPQSPDWLKGYKVRWPLRVSGDLTKQTAKTIIASLPTGGCLKPDASDVVVLTAGGKVVPVVVLSHDAAGETIIQFKRNGNDPWYWAYGVNAQPLPQQKSDPAKPDPDLAEGLTLEVRDWAGENLKNWARVHEGLKKSNTVIGNSLAAEVVQNTNPVRPDVPRKFAASYRGYLQIKKEGIYRFFVNSDDAAFLFIDGFKICERTGANDFITGTVKLKDLGVNVNLKAGVHPLEVHHVVGDNRTGRGRCTLHWMPPGEKKFAFVPRTEFVQPIYARVADVEGAEGNRAAAFAYGNDDMLSGGTKLYLVRFEAQGRHKNDRALRWDFGDGTTGTGCSVRHVYFKGGDYVVSLRGGKNQKPFRRRIHVWPAPVTLSPLSLGLAVRTLDGMEWKKLDVQRVQQIFAFLLVCEQPERWPLVAKVTEHLLDQKDFDLQYRAQLYTARIEALAHLGRANAALKLAKKIEPEFAKVASLKIAIQLAAAAVYQYHLKEATAASKLYKAILDDNRRVEHPNLRLAAVRWGDLYAEAGDLARAGKAYRLAMTLGGAKFTASATAGAATRGALMRIAEQHVRAGNIHPARQILDRLELEYPGRRIDGLYCFVRGEAGRFGGRYEDALRNYETLLKLPQAAGFRGKALHGIADCYYRMGQFRKSLEWYDTIKKTFADYYKKEKLDAVQRLIKGRLERIEAARKKGKPAAAFFRGLSTGFEPGDPLGQPRGFSLVRAPGMQGPHVAFLEGFPAPSTMYDYNVPLKNLTANGSYWVEFWYRGMLGSYYSPASYTYVQIWLADDGPLSFTPPTSALNIDERFGRWRKVGFLAKAPLTQDGNLMMTFRNIRGILEIDGLSVRPVSDRQNDSLLSFNEGAER